MTSNLDPPNQKPLDEQTSEEKTHRYFNVLEKTSGLERKDAMIAEQESGHWARLAVMYAIIANAGGLTLLPRVFTVTGGLLEKIPPSAIFICAVIFILGCIFAAITCFVVYANSQKMADVYYAQQVAAIEWCKQICFGTNANDKIAEMNGRANVSRRIVAELANLASIMALSSWVCFLSSSSILVICAVIKTTSKASYGFQMAPPVPLGFQIDVIWIAIIVITVIGMGCFGLFKYLKSKLRQ